MCNTKHYCLKYREVVNADKSYENAMFTHMSNGNDIDFSKRRLALKANEKYQCENNRNSCFHKDREGNLVKCKDS